MVKTIIEQSEITSTVMANMVNSATLSSAILHSLYFPKFHFLKGQFHFWKYTDLLFTMLLSAS